MVNLMGRRGFLVCAGQLSLGAALSAIPYRLLAAEAAVLDVAYAGSMGSMMEGPLKTAVAKSLNLDFHARAQGSSALAQLIVGGSIRPDVFIPITPGPAQVVLKARKADTAQPIAHTEMVIAYSPKSRFAARFAATAEAVKEGKPGKESWWQILQERGLRFGRTDPVGDPQGRNIIFTMMLAAKLYQQADLVERILGPAINEKQIFTEPSVQARLQSGELDAASAYKIQPGPLKIPYIVLPAEINLSGENVRAQHPDITLALGGKTFAPEPLIYYAAALKDAPNPKGAASFLEWLTKEEAQAIFSKYSYGPPGKASALHA
ncbi:MAG TPA: extracellular solute-binding protein [Candidatus Angelobacter sp.]